MAINKTILRKDEIRNKLNKLLNKNDQVLDANDLNNLCTLFNCPVQEIVSITGGIEDDKCFMNNVASYEYYSDLACLEHLRGRKYVSQWFQQKALKYFERR